MGPQSTTFALWMNAGGKLAMRSISGFLEVEKQIPD